MYSFTFSQDSGVIKGEIIDQKSRSLLAFTNVLVNGTKIGTTSDKKGEFTI